MKFQQTKLYKKLQFIWVCIIFDRLVARNSLIQDQVNVNGVNLNGVRVWLMQKDVRRQNIVCDSDGLNFITNQHLLIHHHHLHRLHQFHHLNNDVFNIKISIY